MKSKTWKQLRFISFIIKRKQRISPLDCRLPSAGWVLVLLRHLRNSNELLDLSAANKIFHSVFLFKCLKRKNKKKLCTHISHPCFEGRTAHEPAWRSSWRPVTASFLQLWHFTRQSSFSLQHRNKKIHQWCLTCVMWQSNSGVLS